MIRILTKEDCCGCQACEQICPSRCICMKIDDEGFAYPHVEQNLCIDCGLCESVCPVLNRNVPRIPLKTFGAVAKIPQVVDESSSGGAFHDIATCILKQGGYVYGASFDEHYDLCQVCIRREEDLKELQGSKYIQSRNGDSYSKINQQLREGHKVLYCGTPCMVAGLKKYLHGNEYPNLITIDFICHGVPSPKLWQLFLKETLDSYSVSHKDVAAISFRDKSKGWRDYRLAIELKSGKKIVLGKNRNGYMKAFAANMSLRPSCYDCQVRKGRSHSDITISDFWDITYIRPDLDNNKGASLVMCNTKKGTDIFSEADMNFFEVEFEKALKHNPAWGMKKKDMPENRNDFFTRLNDCDNVSQLLADILRQPLMKYLKYEFGLLKYRLKLYIKRTF